MGEIFLAPFTPKPYTDPACGGEGELARRVRLPRGSRRWQRDSFASDAERRSAAPLASQRRGGLRGGCVPGLDPGHLREEEEEEEMHDAKDYTRSA